MLLIGQDNHTLMVARKVIEFERADDDKIDDAELVDASIDCQPGLYKMRAMIFGAVRQKLQRS
jgi:hypothetical protein